MKRILLTLALAVLSGAPLMAETTAPAAAAPAVPAALAAPDMPWLTDARPAADAQFYIYLSSASWCGPCRAIMPRVVAMYPAIRQAGGEIILVNFDRSPEAGKAYLEKYKSAFPGIHAKQAQSFPGYVAPQGIPQATFVTPDGKVISNGHGATALRWQTIISNAQTK